MLQHMMNLDLPTLESYSDASTDMMVNLYHRTHFTHLGKYTSAEIRVFCQMVMGLCNKPIKTL